MTNGFKRAAVLLIAGAAFTPAASRAAFVLTFEGATADAAGTRYTYGVVLADEAIADPGDVPSDAVPDFFTLYDVFGLVESSIQVTEVLEAFSETRPFVGVAPEGTNPADDPATRNLTFIYPPDGFTYPPDSLDDNSESAVAALDWSEDGVDEFLGRFSFVSVGSVPGLGDYTGQASSDATGEPLTTTARIVVPGPAVPEPGTLGLLATGGIGLVGGWYRQRRTTTLAA